MERSSAFLAGRMDEAREWVKRSLGVCRGANDRRGEAHALWWLGRIELEMGERDAAGENLRTAIKTFHDFAMHAEVADCLEDHALLALAAADLSAATSLVRAAQQLRQQLKLVPSPKTRQRQAFINARLKTVVPGESIGDAWRTGESTHLKEVIRRMTGQTGL